MVDMFKIGLYNYRGGFIRDWYAPKSNLIAYK